MAQGIIAVGDSITNACSKDLVIDGVAPRSWAEWVAEAAEEPLTVYARPGAPSSVVKTLMPESLGNYALGLVHVGVNNTISWRWWRRDDLQADLRDILTRLVGHCDRVAVLQIPTTLGRAKTLMPYGPFLRRRITEARRTIAQAAAETGAVLIEPPALTGDRVWIDGVHPTSTGHLAMAQATLAELGLPSIDGPAAGTPRPDFEVWRRRELGRFRLRQPVRGVGTWLLGR